MRGNSGRFRAQFPPPRCPAGPTMPSHMKACLRPFVLLCVLPALFAPAARADVAEQARALALQNSRAADGLRVEVDVGQLDPRLKLAPCAQVETYLPNNFKPWGKTRVGLRCTSGEARWNVSLPVTVKVYGRALVAASMLPAGSVVGPNDVQEAEVDLAADTSPAVADAGDAIGRSLLRGLQPGEALRQNQLKQRQWFAAGETVELLARGPGFAVASVGQALGAGLDGGSVRVRTESGRVVTGTAVAERRVELAVQ